MGGAGRRLDLAGTYCIQGADPFAVLPFEVDGKSIQTKLGSD
jgi:hypothetical protein